MVDLGSIDAGSSFVWCFVFDIKLMFKKVNIYFYNMMNAVFKATRPNGVLSIKHLKCLIQIYGNRNKRVANKLNMKMFFEIVLFNKFFLINLVLGVIFKLMLSGFKIDYILVYYYNILIINFFFIFYL